MKTMLRILAVAVTATALAAPAAWAGDEKNRKDKSPAASPNTSAPSRIEGEVVAVNPDAGTMTVRMSDGTTQEFRGNRETLKDYKVGDRIEGRLRSPK